MFYYSFHVGDYVSHTSRLSKSEDLCYRRLLDLYYQTEAPIPLDIVKVAKLIGYRDELDIVSDILSDYFLKSEDGYRNKRCDKEISSYHAKADRARNANDARWNKKNLKSDLKSDADNICNQIPTINHKPTTENHTYTSSQKSDDVCLVTDEIVFQKKTGVVVPYNLIIDAYHDELKELPQVYKLTDARKSRIRKLWMSELTDIEKWKNYFNFISRSSFLTGKIIGKDGRRFQADFDFIINQNNFVKIAEEKYHGQ